MSQYDLPTIGEKPGEQIINDAVSLVDAYNSVRALQAERELNESGKESHIIALPKRRMTFFGSSHTINPDSETISDLRVDLRECLLSVPPNEIAFMIEGQHNGIDREEVLRRMVGVGSIEDAIKNYGESGVAMWAVAEYHKKGIDIEISSPESPEFDIANTLRSEFTADDVAVYLVLRQWTSELGGRRAGEYSTHDFARFAFGIAQLTGVDWIQNMKSVDELRGSRRILWPLRRMRTLSLKNSLLA